MKLLQKLSTISCACIAILLASCSDKDQSSFSIDDIEGKAQITGKLTYNAGLYYENNQYKTKILPAAEKGIIVTIKSSSLSPNGTGIGNFIYETKTDANGIYTIEIPAVSMGNGTEVTIKPEDFIGNSSVFESFENNTVKLKEVEGVYAHAGNSYDVKPNEVKIADIQYAFQERNSDQTRSKALILGNFTYDAGQTYANNQFKMNILPAANKKINVTILYYSTYERMTFETQTDANGNYSFEIPMDISGTNASVTVKPEDFLGRRSLLESFENNNPIFKDTEVVFTHAGNNYILQSNEIRIGDSKYGYTERNIDTGFAETVSFEVKVGLGKIRLANSYGIYGYNEPYFTFQNGINGIIEVRYNGEIDENSNILTRKYGATTNAAGNLIFAIPTRDNTADLNISLEIKPFRDNVVYYEYPDDYTVIEGIYQFYDYGFQSYTYYGNINFMNIPGMTEQREARLILNPFEGHNTSYNPMTYNWNYISFN